MKRTIIWLMLLTLPLFLGANDKKTDQEKKAWEPKIVKAVRAEEPILIDAALIVMGFYLFNRMEERTKKSGVISQY